MNMLRQYDDLTKVLVLEQFSKLPWLAHGFGTKRSHVPAGGVAELRQIHSAAVLFADRAGLTGEGDALITDSPGLALSIRTADCYPILLADSVTRSVAAAHAGWARNRGADYSGDDRENARAIRHRSLECDRRNRPGDRRLLL